MCVCGFHIVFTYNILHYITSTLTCACTFTLQYSTLHTHVVTPQKKRNVIHKKSVSFYMSSNPKKRCQKVCNQDVSSMISTSYFQVFRIAMHMYKIV